MTIDIRELGNIESFYQEMTEPERFEGLRQIEMCDCCDPAEINEAMIELTFKNRKEKVCMGCYSCPDMQEIIKRDQPKIKLINN